MYLELQQVNYIDGPSTHASREGYLNMDPGYGLLHSVVDQVNAILVCAAVSYGGVDSLEEVIEALRHHQLTFAAGDHEGRPFPFAANPRGRIREDDTGQWHERVMYLHDFDPEDIEEIRRAVG